MMVLTNFYIENFYIVYQATCLLPASKSKSDESNVR